MVSIRWNGEAVSPHIRNLAAKEAIIKESFIETKVWEYFEKGEIRSDDAKKILKIILRNITFGNPNEYSIYINLDESIIINIDIDANWSIAINDWEHTFYRMFV